MRGPLASRGHLNRVMLPFVDRDEPRSLYTEWEERVERCDVGIVEICGVGGVGKSRLMSQLISEMPESVAVGRLDFFLPEMRVFDTALLSLRKSLGAILGRSAFPRFDVAFAMYWQATHPGSATTRSQLPFLEESEILNDIVGEMAQIPWISGLIATAKLTTRAVDAIRRHRVLADPLIRELAESPPARLALLLPELFGADLAAVNDGPAVAIAVDSFEALANEPDLVDGSPAYGWLERAIASSGGRSG